VSVIKVLYFIEGTGGGAITHTLILAKYLRELGIESLIVFFLNGPSVNMAEQMGIPFKLLLWRFPLDPKLIFGLRDIIIKEGISIIHTQTITANFYARIVAIIARRPIIFTTIHSFVIDELKGTMGVGLKDWLRYKRDVLTSGLVDQFIAVSPELKKRLVENHFPSHKIEVIPNGIELPCCNSDTSRLLRSEFGIREGEIVIGTVGRLVPLKNHILFLRGAKEILTKMPDIKFMIVGDGVLKDSLKAASKELGIEDRVIFTGWRNDVVSIMSIMDIYALCSLTEAHNISVMEALSLEKPVIGSDIDGIRESVIHEQTGILFPTDDLQSFVTAVLRLIYNPSLRKKMGSKGRQFIEGHYSIKEVAAKTAKLYSQIYYKKLPFHAIHAEGI